MGEWRNSKAKGRWIRADLSKLVLEIDSNGVVKATGNLDAFAKKAKQTEGNTKTLDSVFNKFNLSTIAAGAGCVSLVAGITKLVGALANFTKGSIAAYSEFENVRTNLQIVLGDVELAASTFEELKELGAKTPFSVTGLTDAATQLVQTGTAVEDLTETLRLLGDVSGGSQEKFNRIVQNYAQIQSVGKTTAMDIKQFAMAGLPIYEELEKLGVQGNATAEEINAAFKSMAGEGGKFFNGMAIQSETLTGKVSTLKDTWQEFQATFAENTGLGQMWKGFLDFLTKSIEDFTELLEMKDYNADKNIKSGNYGVADVKIDIEGYIAHAQEEMETIARVRENIYNLFQENNPYRFKALEGTGFTDYMDFMVYANDEISRYSKEIEYLNNQLSFIETQQENISNIFNSNSETEQRVASYNAQYQDAFKEIEEMFSKTEEGKRKELEKTIAMLEETKKLREWELSENKATGLYSATTKQQDEEFLAMIDVLIENTNSQLAKMDEKVEDSILTWREYWQTVTGENIEGKSGAYAARDFLAIFEGRRQTALELSAVLGTDYNEVNESFANELKNIIEKLVTKEGLDESFKVDDNSIEALVRKYKELMALLPKETEEPIKDVFRGWVTELEEAFRESLENGDWNKALGQGIGYAFAAATTGTDVGTFANSYVETGSVETALIETLIQSLAKLVGGFEGLELILNPVQDLLKGFEPVLKSAALVLYYVMSPLRLLGEGLQLWFGWLFGDMSDAWDELVDSQKEEIEKMKDLTAQYEKLKAAIKEQEEYYLKKKTDLNAQTEINNLTRVNDMILTPNGNFSTHPDDYLIATKNPHSLGGGVTVNVKIENTVSDSVNANVSQTTNAKGEQELIVMISKKIAGDVANGANGWDSALNARSQRLQGRMISLW